MNNNYKHSEITEQIIQAYFKVYNHLGYGFLEKVYERALVHELKKIGFDCKSQYPVDVYYDNVIVGYYKADIITNFKVIIEVKAAQGLCEEDECQLINYLKASQIEVGLLLNFGKKAEFKRKVFSSEYKRSFLS